MDYGHEEAKALLRTLKSQTLLFTGPEGVGRRRLARWYAALLNCQTPTDEPCGGCASCLAFAGGHPDYREVAPETSTKSGRASRRPELRIDQLVPRQGGDPEPLSRWLETRPRFVKRVGVIGGAEALTENAANAFLKLLEAPPSYATVILIAPSPQVVLPTIASRSTPVRLGTIKAEALSTAPKHSASRLGCAGDLFAAQQADAFEEVMERVDTYLRVLPKGLEEALEVADALEKIWLAETRFDVAELLRARLGDLEPHRYARALGALEACEAALEAYASPGIAVSLLTLELRAALRD